MSSELFTPTTSNATEDNPRWKECFGSAIEYFRDKLNAKTGSEEYPTARDYFQDRGWADETISDCGLGWAPADADNKLREYLEACGYTKDEMLATGLFGKNLTPLWHGRYVLPYRNEEGDYVYAISRQRVEERHPKDHFDKYSKAKTADEWVAVSEPIYGLDTVREDDPVIITEGIADAISVRQAGYPCVSPVGTRFAKPAKVKLLAKLHDKNVPRAYVIQDAEAPTNEYNEDRDELEINQFGPGIEGAIDTATFLSENGIEARVTTPPRPDREKVDLDDYINDGWGSISALLRSAKPPSQHPAYSDSNGSETTTQDNDWNPIETGDSNRSAIYDLDITDVTRLSVGYRGKNPLGHTGNSENYYKIYSDEWAFDHKRDVGYNAPFHILCETGERRINDPYGALTRREHFLVWKYAKENRFVSSDDPIPHKALIHIATSHDLCAEEEIKDGWCIPRKAHNQALEVVREEYNLEPQRTKLRPEKVVGSTSNTSNTYDADTELPELTLEQAQDRCYQAIDRGLTGDNQYVLIDALPAQGKSYGVVKWSAENNTPLTVLTPRRDLHDQNREWCDEFGLTSHSLPAFHRDCGCASGDHGPEWKQRVLSLYDAGLSGREIHNYAERIFGEPLPCNHRRTCPFLSKWNFDPSDYDVLLGHYLHAYKAEIIEDRVVVIDESPSDDFIESFEPDKLATVVSHFLSNRDEIPFNNYTDLIENRTDPFQREDAISWFEENNSDVESNSADVLKDSGKRAHSEAPVITYALLVGSDLGNEWEHSSLPGGRVTARDRNPDTDHDEPELSILCPPSLEEADTVIGLDGTPCKARWELMLGNPVEQIAVLEEPERAAYIRDVLGQEIYQMSSAAKPYSGGRWLKPERDIELLKQIGERERQLPDLITSRRALKTYKQYGGIEFVSKSKHYGNMIGTNEFGTSRLGVVIGSPNYGDKYLQKWGAFSNEPVEWDRKGRGLDKEYGQFGNKLLQEMRESEVLQSIMRFGRDGDGAKVFVDTGAIPDWVPIVGIGGVKEWSDGMKMVLDTAKSQSKWTTPELSAEIKKEYQEKAISPRQVRRNLDTLSDYDIVKKIGGHTNVWENICVEDAPADRYVYY